MLKRFLAICLALPLALLCVGCDNPEAPKSPKPGEAAAKGAAGGAAPAPASIPSKGGKTAAGPGGTTTAD